MTERARCSLCGGDNPRPLYRGCRSRRSAVGDRFDLLRCPNCGAVFLSPAPRPEVLSQLYRSGYPSYIPSLPSEGTLFRAAKSLCLLPYRLRFGCEEGTFPPFGQGRLLDVGCGVGDYLFMMRRLGWRCFGCDVSSQAVEQARRRIPDAALTCGSTEELSFAPASFEAVTLWHTLEHLPDPLGSLQRIRKWLTPQGRLIVAVPNVASLEAKTLGKRWLEIDIPGHLFFFSTRTLRALLEKAGFRCLRIRPQVHPSTVSDAAGFFLDDLLGKRVSRQRQWLYLLLYPGAVLSYPLGNWGCLEVTAAPQ